MIITPIDHGLTLAHSDLVRSSGLHMSDIYGDLFRTLEPKRYDTGDPPDLLRFEAGFALETMLEEGLKKRLVGERPGEFTTEEGIAFSPDLIIFNGATRVGEMKLTWLSSREMPRVETNCLPPKMDKWLVQIKAYCHHLRTQEARLFAFFVNGDYKPPRPELLAYDLLFTQRELADNWTMLLNHAKYRGMI